MKNRRGRAQREEIRRILHAMRLELAAQRLVQEKETGRNSLLRLNEFMTHVHETAS